MSFHEIVVAIVFIRNITPMLTRLSISMFTVA